MQFWIKKCLAAALLAGAVSPFASFEVKADDKTQTITFVEDDAQKYMGSKIYTLKHIKAADLIPFVLEAVKRYTTDSNVSSVNDTANNRQMIIVSSGVNIFPYIDKMIATLDRPSKMNANGSTLLGDGIAVGFYRSKFRANEDMRDIMIRGQIFGGADDAQINFDPVTGLFFFKDAPSVVDDIKSKLSWFDKPTPQVRLEFTVYELRDSDLRDIGIDYLAWKNGPGLNLFSAGYEAISMKAAEKIFSTLAKHGVNLVSNATYGFGGFYTAPAFDASFIRLLQQNGKASISSTASVAISNTDRIFTVSFAPEYQNITKDEDHISDVKIGSDASVSAKISDVVITSGKKGVANFSYEIATSNVVERNNFGAEIAETSKVRSSNSLAMNQETLLSSLVKTTRVDQTVGVPFLCELPVLKYIFGTTTTNIEKTHYFITARAIPLVYNENVTPGIAAEFNELCKK